MTQQNTAYGEFVKACWTQHQRMYPDEQIAKEIEEFNLQCSTWWYNISEEERGRFQEIADSSNATQAMNTSATTHIDYTNTIPSNNSIVQNVVNSTTAESGIPVLGSTFSDNKYGLQGGAIMEFGQVGHQYTGGRNVQKPNQKSIKDPNAPKKPLSAYFLFNREERLKVKADFPDYAICDVAKEVGRRWATINPAVKLSYEERYKDSRRVYEQEMQAFKPHKKKKDPNAPKHPLSAYFIFNGEERLKIKNENPRYTICEIAKEVGRRWADMPPEVKQQYQRMSEEKRLKYDQEMAAYLQGNYVKTEDKEIAAYLKGNYVNTEGPSATTTTSPSATTVVPVVATTVATQVLQNLQPLKHEGEEELKWHQI